MKRAIENLKSFILTILIISSLVLTGSLWFDNYQGLSLRASSFFNEAISSFYSNKEISIVHDKIIMPYKVSVVNPDKNKWIFYASDDTHQNAWDIIKNRLNTLNDDSEIITGKVKEWEGLFTRKSIIFEFGGPLEYEVLRLAIPNLPKETDAFNNVEKIAVTKSLDGNTIYILQNDNGKKYLYKILLKGEDSEIEKFMENCENLKADVRYLELERLGTTKFFGNKEVVPQNGTIFPVANVRNHRDIVKQLNMTTYFDIQNEYDINRFVIEIFDNTDFAKFVTNDESKIFINDDKSSIKFEKNGVVEYINNSKSTGEVTSAAKNFNEAVEFISNMRVYDNIYLLDAKEDDGTYTFTFAVAVNGILLGFENPVISDDSHAMIEVTVSEGTVRYFKGKLLDLEATENGSYIFNFAHNILDNMLSKVEENTKVNIYSIELIYLCDNTGTYYPSWIIKYNDKKSEDVKTCITYTMKR